jgi:hypothetical protein
MQMLRKGLGRDLNLYELEKGAVLTIGAHLQYSAR